MSNFVNRRSYLLISILILGVLLSSMLGFAVLAYVANHAVGYNYMFLMYHDGTPYSIFYNLVGGNPVLYPMIVVAIFVAYIVLFYYIYHLIISKKSKEKGE